MANTLGKLSRSVKEIVVTNSGLSRTVKAKVVDPIAGSILIGTNLMYLDLEYRGKFKANDIIDVFQGKNGVIPVLTTDAASGGVITSFGGYKYSISDSGSGTVLVETTTGNAKFHPFHVIDNVTNKELTLNTNYEVIYTNNSIEIKGLSGKTDFTVYITVDEVLQLPNATISSLVVGDRFKLFGKNWTVVSKTAHNHCHCVLEEVRSYVSLSHLPAYDYPFTKSVNRFYDNTTQDVAGAGTNRLFLVGSAQSLTVSDLSGNAISTTVDGPVLAYLNTLGAQQLRRIVSNGVSSVSMEYQGPIYFCPPVLYEFTGDALLKERDPAKGVQLGTFGLSLVKSAISALVSDGDIVACHSGYLSDPLMGIPRFVVKETTAGKDCYKAYNGTPPDLNAIKWFLSFTFLNNTAVYKY